MTLQCDGVNNIGAFIMKLINKDLTREKVWVNVCGNQIYAEVFSKAHGKWVIDTYFKDFGFEVDRELCELTIKTIYKLWRLENPKVYLAFGN